MSAKQLGIFTACKERDIDPQDFVMKLAAMDVMDQKAVANVDYHRKVASTFYHLFNICGRGQTKCARHLRALSTHPEWTHDSQDTIDHVYDFLAGTEYCKEASAMNAVAGGGKLLGVLSALFGGAAGVAYWQMKRNIDSESTNNEVMKNQIGYYNQLTGDLENSMNTKYGYGE